MDFPEHSFFLVRWYLHIGYEDELANEALKGDYLMPFLITSLEHLFFQEKAFRSLQRSGHGEENQL